MFILCIYYQFIVYSFTEMVPELLKLDGAKFIYGERFCQDSLELFLGNRGQEGGGMII